MRRGLGPNFSPRWNALGRCRKGGALQAAENLVGAVILSMDSRRAAIGDVRNGCSVASWRSRGSASYDRRVGFSCPAGAQDSSRGQRPRKAPRSFPDPEGVALPWAAGGMTGVMPPGFDPCRVGVGWGDVFRGRCPRLLYRSPAGIKDGPCRGGSGAQKAGKKPSRPLGLTCSIEVSNSSSFWRAKRRTSAFA